MKILILTQYFPPETGAPQNRLFGLGKHLVKLGARVTVLTAMPNYPAMEIFPAYRNKSYMTENMVGMEVHRCGIHVNSKRGVISRLRNYFSFVISSIRAGRKLLPHFDFLICESPPLFLAYSAIYLAGKKKAKLVFNVSDLWPESAEKLGVVTNKWLLKPAYRLEARAYQKSALVTGQTQGICKNISSRFPDVKTYWLPNGIDPANFDPDTVVRKGWRQKYGISESDTLFMYAGIVGIAQGLEVILAAADELRDESTIRFAIIGEGPEKNRLLQLKKKLKLDNVIFAEPVGREEMPAVIAETDVAIVPLKKLDLFRGAIPSKIFENLAMRKPVLLGVDGEAKEIFAEQGRCAVWFEPENVAALALAVKQLAADKNKRKELGENGRKYVLENFDRGKISEGLYRQLQSLL